MKLAFRNLFRQKTRTAMTLSAIVFGVVALIISGGFVQDIFIQLRDATIHSRLGYLQVYRTGYYLLGRSQPYEYMIDSPDRLIDASLALPQVVDVMKRLSFSGLINNGRTDRPIIGEGIEAGKEAEMATFLTIIEGRQLRNDDEYSILLGEGVARALQLRPGDFVTLLLNTTAGAMNVLEFEIAGVFRTFSKDFDARAVRIPLETAFELLDTESVHSLVFSLDNAESTDAVANWLRQGYESSGYEVKTWYELDDFYRKTVELYKRQFGVLQVIILGIVFLSVANSVSMTAHERIGELGTLRALGRRSSYVYKLLVTENVVLALLGASLGVAVGIAVAHGLSNLGIPMPPPPNASGGYTAYIRIVPSAVSLGFAVGMFSTIVSAVLVAYRPSRVPIAEALRENI